MTALSHLHTDLEIKAVDPLQRVISGFAAYHSNRDRVQDIIDASASAKAVGRLIPKAVGVFIGHKTDTLPMGIPLVIEARPEGLYTETLIKPGPSGDDLLATAAFLQQHGSPLGMSIGYRTRDSKMERGIKGITRRILDYDLMEYSYAANQSIANESALVVGVKAGAGGGSVYQVEARGDQWAVIDTGDGDTVGTYADEATANAVRDALTAEMAEEMGDGDMPMGGASGKTAPADAVKAVWSTAFVNDLPDSSFLYVESGGQKDDAGKTVPRSLRHFPYKDAEGKIDLPHLRNAIARIPQTDALDAAGKQRLQARAQRMLADAQGGSSKLAADEPEWQAGAVPLVAYVGYTLLDVADQIAEGQKAMALLGEDCKAGARMQGPMRQKLREAMATLQNVLDWAEMADSGADAAAKVARYQRELQLLGV